MLENEIIDKRMLKNEIDKRKRKLEFSILNSQSLNAKLPKLSERIQKFENRNLEAKARYFNPRVNKNE